MGLFDWFRGRSATTERAESALSTADATDPHDVADPDQALTDQHDQTKDQLLFPRARYQGEFTPANLAFDNNLQEFAQRVVFICSLENSGKMTPDEAHQQIKSLYKELTRSHKGLKIADDD